MPWIKVLLIASALLVLVLLFRHRDRVLLRAGTRLAALALFLLAVVSIVFPDIPQDVAQRVGVVRGTDLLLYLLVVVFTLSTLGLFFRLREMDHHVHQLARALAIQEALRREEKASADPGNEAGDRSEVAERADGAGEQAGGASEEGIVPEDAQRDDGRSATTTNSLYANTFPARRGKGKE
jgi:hypothetical protein